MSILASMAKKNHRERHYNIMNAYCQALRVKSTPNKPGSRNLPEFSWSMKLEGITTKRLKGIGKDFCLGLLILSRPVWWDNSWTASLGSESPAHRQHDSRHLPCDRLWSTRSDRSKPLKQCIWVTALCSGIQNYLVNVRNFRTVSPFSCKTKYSFRFF